MNINKHYECRSCHNEWTVKQGFNIKTKQCPMCQKWDDEKPQREKEWEERQKFLIEKIDFPYVPGDPFW